MDKTPEQKGDELIEKFMKLPISYLSAINGSIIAVEEIMKVMDGDSFYAVNLIEEKFIPVDEYWSQVLNYLKSKQ